MRKSLTILCLLLFSLSPCIAQSQLDKVELEQAFWDDLTVYRPKAKTLRPENPKRIGQNLYVSENGFYETESAQNTSFFKKALFSWIPVCESSLPEESVMTLLTGYTGKRQYTVHLLQHRYKFGTAEMEVPLIQLLEYCMDNGCKPYVGIESSCADTLAATLFMVNAENGYCHTFQITLDKALLDLDEGTIRAEAYTFTPIHNLKQ